MSEVGNRNPLPSLLYFHLMWQHLSSDHDDITRMDVHSETKMFNVDMPPLEISKRHKYCVQLFMVLFIHMIHSVTIK